MMKMAIRALALGLGGIAAAGAAIMPAGAAAPAPAPVPFWVYDSGSALVTAHPVIAGERLVIKGRGVTLGSVTHPGPAYVAHILGVLPPAWTGKTLAAVRELP